MKTKESKMNSDDLISSFSELKNIMNIDRETLMKIIQEVFKGILDDQFGENNYELVVNPDKGVVQVTRKYVIVEDGEVNDPKTEIELSRALKSSSDFEVGEEFYEIVDTSNFFRRDILKLRQNLSEKMKEYQRTQIYQKYKDMVGMVVKGEVHLTGKKEIIVNDEEGIELTLPSSEQIPGDRYRKGDTLKAVVLKVEMDKNKAPIITLSRTAPVFLERLLESEVPEIYDGVILIKNIVRVPGERAKVAVESLDDHIDPVGSCVGVRGSRIHGIVRELHNESIDVLPWAPRVDLMIQRALAPAEVLKVTLRTDKTAKAYMNQSEMSKAIGKNGLNIKLAGDLVGYKVEVESIDNEFVDEDDVNLKEFNDEIDQWIIDELIKNGFDTAKQVLAKSKQEIMDRVDLEEETVDDLFRILQAEFDDDNNE